MIFWIILWIAVAVGAPMLLFFIGSKNKPVKIGLQLLLFVAVIFLSYSLYQGIMTPIRFEKEKTKRYKAAVQQLIKVRTAQEAYKNVNQKYTPDFDSLIQFAKTDSLRLIVKIGTVPDSILERPDIKFDRVLGEKYALEKKYIRRDTVKVSVLDSLFKGYDINELGKVPYQKGKRFKMDTATLEISGLFIPVFEASVQNKVLLDGLDKQLIINLDDDLSRSEKFTGLKVGSLTENNNNEGNWSKDLELK